MFVLKCFKLYKWFLISMVCSMTFKGMAKCFKKYKKLMANKCVYWNKIFLVKNKNMYIGFGIFQKRFRRIVNLHIFAINASLESDLERLQVILSKNWLLDTRFERGLHYCIGLFITFTFLNLTYFVFFWTQNFFHIFFINDVRK